MKLRKSENWFLLSGFVGMIMGLGIAGYFNFFAKLDSWWVSKNLDFKLGILICVLVCVYVTGFCTQKKQNNNRKEQ